ncbi:MAG: two-component system sensor histidine kinase NtrB [Gemmatimonadota bacterium]
MTRARPLAAIIARGTLLLVLLGSTAAILFATARTAGRVSALADTSLETTALALSTAAESALRSGSGGTDGEIRQILSDRVVAYALIAARDGTILFHTNPSLTGSRIPEAGLNEAFRSGRASGRRVTLGTGLPAFAFDYVLHRPDGSPELLRLVLHTVAADRIAADARRMWWTVGAVLVLLWAAGILLDRAFERHARIQAEAETRERLALIGQMTASLSHEIRNALGSVKGFAQWADEKTPAPDPRKEALASVIRGAARIEALVDDLLLFSREETYGLELVDVEPLFREAVAEAPPWQGSVTLEVAPGTRAAADRDKLRRVLANGIRNAIQAMGSAGRLALSARTEGDTAALRIEDTGPGIPEAERPRLFTPFHTTKSDGTGLGLAYSKKVVEGMGGRIELSSREGGGGAVLLVILPARLEARRAEDRADRG